ncbi:Translation factor GUF1-like, mitochondrial [Hondaea fermentalgiana]|uniref:Translation factor GUF1 homolog, mitochondrial n=1 Tax=Hondaea fermentalgiana TaxID=2315210 RepID=A0A2R5GDU7_9STRA|nr:Translation factor GUF1-like, mitochondrial [Hondaea fermentalgiana]|eukprot:GBG27898.1 Translation factor GUF1-like, mitochondrial [Hondaea fermentalgiana]
MRAWTAQMRARCLEKAWVTCVAAEMSERLLPRHVRMASSSSSSKGPKKVISVVDQAASIPRERMRNFVIAAHVDHGKSSLADKLLEIAGNLELAEGGERQVLDDLKVERERGITVKARTASMVFDDHLLNLVDTPGHVDFDYEVKRSLQACQGALLLVDSTQGVQAQTLANYNLARDAGLQIIPVLTKLDLSHSDPATSLEQIEQVFGIPEDEVIWTSAKTGEGCDEILPAVIKRLPPPPDAQALPLQAITAEENAASPPVAKHTMSGLIFDSWYDRYMGVVCLVYVEKGTLQVGQEFFTDSQALGQKRSQGFQVQEVGMLVPQPMVCSALRQGQVGFMFGNIKDSSLARVGDAISDHLDGLTQDEETLEARKVRSTPKVYASIFPLDGGDFDELRKSLERLLLNDSSVAMRPETSGALGNGFLMGFLGKLHMEVFFQRLEDEFGTEIIATAPAVPYWADMRGTGERVRADIPAQLPPKEMVEQYLEPMAHTTVIAPIEYMGEIFRVFKERRGVQTGVDHMDETRVVIKHDVPWQEVIVDLHDVLKTVTSGFASLEYEEAPPRVADITKVDILVNGNAVDALAFVAHRSVAARRGRAVAQKLRSVIARQQFEIVIQAASGPKIIARERIPPFRKDVLTKSGKTVGGGDMSRKRKLLEKQKAGKKKMKSVGNVELPQSAFYAMNERDDK